jgi:RNA polymerase sigma-70 factor (ECF subfamily)
MTETPDSRRDNADPRDLRAAMTASEVDVWFAREVLPLEAALMQFLQHHWRNRTDVEDLVQDVYVRIYEAAQKEIPDHPRRFVFTTARNLLIDRARRAQIIPIEALPDADTFDIALDVPSPERSAIARDELRRLQEALDRLPARNREAVVLARVEGLTGREISQRMGLAEATVSHHLAKGIAALTDMLYGDAPKDGGSK